MTMISRALTFFLFLNTSIAMSAWMPRNGDEPFARTVISALLSDIPDYVDAICVMNVDLSGPTPTIKPSMPAGMDKRIVGDATTCSGAISSERTVAIYYFGDIGELIETMQQPQRPDLISNFTRVKSLARSGDYIIIGASLNKCDSQSEAFIFDKASDGGRFIERTPIGLVECTVHKKAGVHELR